MKPFSKILLIIITLFTLLLASATLIPIIQEEKSKEVYFFTDGPGDLVGKPHIDGEVFIINHNELFPD